MGDAAGNGRRGHLLAIAGRAALGVMVLRVNYGLLGLGINLPLTVLVLHEIIGVPLLKQVVHHVLTGDASALGNGCSHLLPKSPSVLKTEHPGKLTGGNTSCLNKLIDVPCRGLVHIHNAVHCVHGSLEHLRV